ncbi:MAG: hypothetical protein NUV73_04135 [Candidatus Daviesbacteria bacterium]|nr:hypothetical protein [Candidatus Daviesbacteria bacterium]
MDYGMKVSKPGFDVKTAADKDLVFSSKFDTFKVHSTGIGSFTANGALQTATIAHTLGYLPAFFVFSEVHAGFGEPTTGDFYMMPHSPPASTGGSLVTDTIIASIDASNLYIRLGSLVVASGKVINYKWVIFHNPIQ